MNRLAAFIERDIRLALAYPYAVLVPFVSIVITVAGFAYLSRLIDPQAQVRSAHESLDYFSYVVLNLSFMLLLNGALQAVSGAIRRDQVAGTLEAIVATPTSLPIVVLASALWPIAFAALQAGAYLGSGMLFGLRLHAFNPGAFLAVLVLSITCMMALGALGAAVVIRYKQAPPSSFLTGSAVAMLSGALFPVALLPPALRGISWLLPLTHALNGLRGSLSGVPVLSLFGELLWLAVATVLLAPISLTILGRSLQRARRDGTLSSY
jgi:ABC-2 type transport system permease protein